MINKLKREDTMQCFTLSRGDHFSHYRLVKMLELTGTRVAIDCSRLHRDFDKLVVESGVNKASAFLFCHEEVPYLCISRVGILEK